MSAESRHRSLLANRYQLVELIGSGAMGQVYRAEDKLLGGVTVAVKLLSQTLLNQRMRERFEREATISALLGEKSIHVVKVRDYGVDDKEVPFYVMEFLQGGSISEIIKHQPLPLPRFLNLTRQICFGLECAHKGIIFQGEMCPIIHRDIKPSNIMVVQDSGLGELVKILDFGIAKLIQSGESQTQSFMGTLAYCSPEQMEGKELDHRSDIYSFGIMMYEMITGETPVFPNNPSFGGWYEVHHYAEPRSFNSSLQLPPELEQLIRRCLAKAPSDRPSSVTDILQRLERLEPLVKNEIVKKTDDYTSKIKTLDDLNQTIVSAANARDICLKSSWPEDKPHQKIVFSRCLRAADGVFASLWVMLAREDIAVRVASVRYNKFLFLPTPHPMLLWITLLYHRQWGPRWLPCYLDLKTPQGQKMTKTLAETSQYWILFFSLEGGPICENVITANIPPNQCQILRQWVTDSQLAQVGSPQISKRMLKQKLEQLKPQILGKLASEFPLRP
ncbi:MAG: serine/threonine protein kinase [Microcystis aeruginosa G13-01]|jgi:serine/threonine-protein kinase|nr:serine/threonine protein kinase [Microcystis aeruginosa SX13-11]NCR89384.1 serine/threonine protein kinase [Microcystis aeruginosa G13-10]NCS20308.1 serine/threonine protein kinase [Microcystis aeruginosa G11-06]NCS34756.1 serine/threonine protein kinase [Microcystis aeruginosa G11-01]NCT64200.1 serine/threonine protein kinase [Microcystis aeruginosa G13-01]